MIVFRTDFCGSRLGWCRFLILGGFDLDDRLVNCEILRLFFMSFILSGQVGIDTLSSAYSLSLDPGLA